MKLICFRNSAITLHSTFSLANINIAIYHVLGNLS